ncbi:hypothetical protein AX15_000541 [Amanita polypyramis BW_CC]|nr:hypothetical protein AX15_000541 [Amanita polypyramis BW_CC]
MMSFPLAEMSRVLDLLFVFIYPEPTPDVKSLPFKLLIELAEAAKKYRVFSVTYITKHPIEVLRYAAMHGYVDLLDVVAPAVIGKQLGTVVATLPSDIIIPWVTYNIPYLPPLSLTIFMFRFDTINNGTTHC